ncbi:MAG: NAD(P)-binding domain-containing protein [Holophagales bacterium]|nr:NAD(P)-binding domain-containing protein [Holophagales bacterium]
MSIAIVGAGNVGANLGIRLAETGHDVTFGVRRDKDLSPVLEQCGGRASVAPIPEAVAGAELIFLAVPASAAVDALAGAPEVGSTARSSRIATIPWPGPTARCGRHRRRAR